MGVSSDQCVKILINNLSGNSFFLDKNLATRKFASCFYICHSSVSKVAVWKMTILSYIVSW